MSVNLPILDQPKPWFSARYQDVKIDGSLTIEGVPFTDTPKTALTGSVSGSFLVAPQVLSAEITDLNSVVTLRVAGFTVGFGNQNATGNLDFTLPIPSALKPVASLDQSQFIVDTSGNGALTRLEYDFVSETFRIYATPSVRAFTRNTSATGTGGDFIVTWNSA